MVNDSDTTQINKMSVSRVALVISLSLACQCELLPTSQQVPSSQLFRLPLAHDDFSFPAAGVSFRPSLQNMPDLPSWLYYSYSRAVHQGFIYGSPPPQTNNFSLEVIATDKHTYETSRRIFNMDVLDRKLKAYEIRFKITNMNVEELLVRGRYERLFGVLREDVWPDSLNDLAVTSLTPASHKGDRMPLKPNEKEGLYVGFGSNSNFSEALHKLEKEVGVLWDNRPCPIYFKKTHVERFFRPKGFAIDWCSFKLFRHESDLMGDSTEEMSKSPVISALENAGRIYLPTRDEIVKRSYTFDVIHTILIPMVVMLLLLALLTLAMCCHRNNIMPTVQDIQMVHYGLKNNERLMKEHSPHPSTLTQTTQADTLPHSRNGSPSSTLPRQQTPRRFEDYATLARPDPPPYQRNGATPTYYDDNHFDDNNYEEDDI